MRQAQFIRLEGLEFFGRHGVFDFERQEGQTFRVDVELQTADPAAGRDDRLEGTVDYGRVYERVRERVEGEPRRLLERLAGEIADDLWATYDLAWLRVRLHKPQAPLPGPFRDVVVEVERGERR